MQLTANLFAMHCLGNINRLVENTGATWRHRNENFDGKLIAEIWGAVAIGAGTLGAAALSSSAAGDAASDQENASEQANQIQQQEHQQTVNNLNPYNQAGTNALSTMNNLNNGNFSSFTQSPDYQFALNQGIGAMDASAAAKGTLFSGGYGKDLQQYGQGLATQNYNNYYNHLSGVASLGENAAAQVGNSNQAYANQVGANDTASGAAAAQGALGTASSLNTGINQLSQLLGQYNSTYGGTGSGMSTPVPTQSIGSSVDSDISNYGNSLSGLGS